MFSDCNGGLCLSCVTVVVFVRVKGLKIGVIIVRDVMLPALSFVVSNQRPRNFEVDIFQMQKP